MKRHVYRNKAPYSTLHPDARHWTRKGSSWKQKVGYDTEDEAWEFLEQNPKLKAMGERPYFCELCSKWHIGKRPRQRPICAVRPTADTRGCNVSQDRASDIHGASRWMEQRH